MTFRGFILALLLFFVADEVVAQPGLASKPRIIISIDIGGTDPNDNQSFSHFLMYADLFQTEGLIPSPSYGNGSRAEMLRMIDLYEKDLPKLMKHATEYPAPFKGYTTSTEGADWIIKCAMKESDQPLWLLVWGGLEDVTQALHDASGISKELANRSFGRLGQKMGLAQINNERKRLHNHEKI